MKKNAHKNIQKIKKKLAKLNRSNVVSVVVVVGIALLGVHIFLLSHAASNPPTVVISNLTANAYVNTNAQAINVTVTPNDGGSISSCSMSVNSVTVGSPITVSPYNFVLNTLNLANGTANLAVSCTDDQGDVGTASLSLVVNNGDLSNSGSVGIFDLTTLASNWGKSGQSYAEGNITGNSAIGIYDLAVLAKNWGWTAQTGTYSCNQPANGGCSFTADATNFVGMNNPYLTTNGTSSLGTLVNNNLYSPISGEIQSLEANSASNWRVISNTPANTSVTTYPNAGTYAYTGVLDDYTSLTSDYDLTMPVNSNTIAWATTDDWLSEPGTADGLLTYEIQIHMDYSLAGSSSFDCPATWTPGTGINRGNYGVVATGINIDGVNWFLCDGQIHQNSDGTCQEIPIPPNSNGTLNVDVPECGELIFVQGSRTAMGPNTPTVSGTLNLKDFYQWLETNNVPGQTYPYMLPGSRLSALSTGYEIATTTGTTENFDHNAFTVDAVGAPTPSTSKPAGVTFTAGSGHTCVLSWTGSGLATNGYTGYVYGEENGYFFQPAGTTANTFTGTASGQTFNAELAFSNNGGNGAFTGYYSCTTT